MSVTENLLRVFKVDQQLQGLQSRLRAAERFLDEQTKQLQQLESKRDAVVGQLKAIQAVIADQEGEMARLDARIDSLREQMNNAKTNKEYKAFLTEVSTLKADRSTAETAALEQMGKADELKKLLAEYEGQHSERAKVKQVAAGDRDKRADEIRDRVAQLQQEREKLVKEVPADVLKIYVELCRTKGDEAMAPVNELDPRHHEYTCGSCQMTLQVEVISALIRGVGTRGSSVARCSSCGTVLYLEPEMAERLDPSKKPAKKGKKSAEVEQL